MMKLVSIKTPCIGICSTTSVGDSICRGCKRFASEVIEWNLYSDFEKAAVLSRLSRLVEPLMEERFIIRSRSDLAAGLKRLAVPFNEDLPPAIWLHNLLKKRHRALTDLVSFGVDVRPLWQHLSLPELAEDVDRQLLVLSEAHLSRYFPEMARPIDTETGINESDGGNA
ncbi:MAG: DUF1289 domain-containing protein [Pseudohongiella sp.]|nr:DUF1289 domain-containing protein [Pseudohongiella sp.]